MTTTYTIQTFDAREGRWTADGIGESTGWPTQADAERAVDSLIAMGGEWADAEYRILEDQTGYTVAAYGPDADD